jgi:hypothetical protein
MIYHDKFEVAREYKNKFIGWCNDGEHDKVWGVICLQAPPGTRLSDYGKWVTFWGRRGAKLQTKIQEWAYHDSIGAIQKKMEKGYNIIDQSKLDEVYPDFQTDLEKTEVWALLKL